MNNNFARFQKIITNPIKYNLFMLTKLPMGFFSGLKIVELNAQTAAVSVKFKWMNQNPFKSIYFAVLSMAAELSTGILAFGYIYNSQPNVSMLVSRVEADFVKKATGTIVFTCNNGNEIAKAIETTLATGQGITVACTASGINQQGEVVAQFNFTWSFKAKSV